MAYLYLSQFLHFISDQTYEALKAIEGNFCFYFLHYREMFHFVYLDRQTECIEDFSVL